MRLFSKTLFIALVGLSCASPAKQPPAPSAAATLDAEFQKTANEIYEAYFERIPTTFFGGSLGVSLGMHRYDGRLPDDSPAALKARAAFLADARTRLERFPAAGLSETSRVERDVFVTRLRGALFELETRRSPWRSPLYYLGALSLSNYVSRDYAPLIERARAVVSLCRAAGPYLATGRKNLESKLPRAALGFAISQIGEQQAFIEKDVTLAVAGVTDPKLKEELAAGLPELVAQLGVYRDDLKARLPPGTDDFALGPEAFSRCRTRWQRPRTGGA